MENCIDFVILWVDGSDEEWLTEKNRYSQEKEDIASAKNRFRDWDNLQFLFRGIDQFAPWVRYVHFITWGHLPKWLDTGNPKLKIVNHKDYIPEKYLPTFNSDTIELNLHRLEGLSEQFVLFNDDTFLLRPAKPEDFFIDGVPRDEFAITPVLPLGETYRTAHTIINNTGIINQRFSKKACFKKNWRKYFNRLYGKNNIRTILMQPFGCFVGFRNPHLPIAHLKSTFKKLWELEEKALDDTCMNRFRGYNDLNHWLMRYWNLCQGNFIPRSSSFGKYFNITDDNTQIVDYITGQKGTLICTNDMSNDIDFESAKRELIEAFQKILPEKSSFEKE